MKLTSGLAFEFAATSDAKVLSVDKLLRKL